MAEAYKLTPKGAGFGVQRLSDGAWIPEDERNADWRMFKTWVAEGNTPLPADPPPGQATRWQVDQQMVIERLEAAHRFGAFMDIIDDANQLTRELWRARYRIWNDDPLVVALLGQAGANPALILARPV